MRDNTTALFGHLPDGRRVDQFWIGDETGISACISTLGAAVTQLWVADRQAQRDDVVLGFDDVRDYLRNPFHVGVTIGRYANRIANAAFELNGEHVALAGNVVGGRHHLHGGPRGFGHRLWDLVAHDATSVSLRIDSAHNDQGYPGNLTLTARFHIIDGHTLAIDYEASTDRTTVINVTNHSYFNLAGQHSNSVLDHELHIAADRFTVTDEDSIPTGEIRALPAALDFRVPRRLGEMIDNPVLMATSGYDHNYVLKDTAGEWSTAATLTERRSGRTLTVRTTEPGMQLYTANHLRSDSSKTGKGYVPFQAVCLETQHFPDSPNHASFPSTVLRPGELMKSSSHYQFGIVD
ncbi:MAG: aldose epimerase family protein [Pseudomonadota bacterium]